MTKELDDLNPEFRMRLQAVRWGFEAGFMLGANFLAGLPDDMVDMIEESTEDQAREFMILACERLLAQFSRDSGLPFDTVPSTIPDELFGS